MRFIFITAVILAILGGLASSLFAQKAEKPEFDAKEPQIAPIGGADAPKAVELKVGDKILNENEYKTKKSDLIDKYEKNSLDYYEANDLIDVLNIEIQKRNGRMGKIEGRVLSEFIKKIK